LLVFKDWAYDMILDVGEEYTANDETVLDR
jgi:hypothetical protein